MRQYTTKTKVAAAHQRNLKLDAGGCDRTCKRQFSDGLNESDIPRETCYYLTLSNNNFVVESI
uniref:Uncharacterized protein n=1 Tax=Arion vulgaris TaxID=1028688 RepID=A0A0B7BXQ6_9EUPU